MPLNTSWLQVAGSAGATDITLLSLHSAVPDATGSNLTTAAKVTAALSCTGGVVSIPSARAFTGGAANGPIAAIGFWSGTTWRGYLALTGDTSFNAAGQYTVNTTVITGGSTG